MRDALEVMAQAIYDAEQILNPDEAKAAASAALTALQAEGMAVVPVEPTEAMLRCEPYESRFPPDTAESVKQSWRDEYREIWSAMLAAAHTQEKDA